MPEEIFKKQAKEASGGTGYVPFTLSAAKYNNSPIEKNFGSPIQRGITTHIESNNPEAVSQRSGTLYASVGSSPAKGWFKKLVGGAKKAISGKGVLGALVNPAAAIARKTGLIGKDDEEKNPAETAADAAQAAQTAASGGAVPPHTHDESGGVVGGGGETVATGDPMIDAARGLSGAVGVPKDQVKKVASSNWGGVGSGVDTATAAVQAFSDIRLKEKIQRTGTSPSGIPIYEFNYIGDNNRYSGAMAQDLLDTNAISIHESGYYTVDYSSIDVDMKIL